MPVLFDPRVATTLLGHFVAAISGSAIARKSSFLLDPLGERVFAPGVTIHDDPFRRAGFAAARSTARAAGRGRWTWSSDGVLTTWMAESASARQLGIQPDRPRDPRVSGAPGAGPPTFIIERATVAARK